MDKGSAAVCYAFLKKLPSQEQHALLKHFSPEQFHEFNQSKKLQEDPTSGIPPLEEELSHIHFSWLAPLLRSLPEGDIKLFLGCLTEDQQLGLKQSLLFSNHIPSVSLIGNLFLKRQLFSSLVDQKEILPLSCLSEEPINALLTLSYEDLLMLIDLLSMHDLAVEIRQIIDTTKLKRIYSLLSHVQTKFLKALIYRKEPVVFKKLELANWDGRTETLLSTLEQRGINRLAKALYREDPSLLWYVTHRLDTDRGSLLNKLCTSLDHPRAAILLSEQVIDLIHMLKNQNYKKGSYEIFFFDLSR